MGEKYYFFRYFIYSGLLTIQCQGSIRVGDNKNIMGIQKDDINKMDVVKNGLIIMYQIFYMYQKIYFHAEHV